MSELGKDASLVNNVGSVGYVSEGHEGAADDETRRDRRELREPEGEGGGQHDQQDRAQTRRTERDVDHVSERVNVCNCGKMGHLARDCRRKGLGMVKGRPRGKGYADGTGKTMRDTGQKGPGKFAGSKGRYPGSRLRR